MRIFQFILLGSLGLCLSLSSSALALEITAVGGVNYASPDARQNQNTIDWTGNASLVYGAFIAADLFTPRLQLETGILSLGSEMQGYPASVNTTDDFRETQIPLLLRFNFDPWLSLGVGGYVAFGSGEVSTAANGSTIKQSFSSAGFTSNDSGLTVSLKAKLHFNNDLAFVIDTRYEHGLKNRAINAGDDFATRSIQVLAGLGYEF